MLIGGTCQEGKRKENSAGKPFSLYLISAVVSPRRFDKSSLISEARKEKKEWKTFLFFLQCCGEEGFSFLHSFSLSLSLSLSPLAHFAPFYFPKVSFFLSSLFFRGKTGKGWKFKGGLLSAWQAAENPADAMRREMPGNKLKGRREGLKWSECPAHIFREEGSSRQIERKAFLGPVGRAFLKWKGWGAEAGEANLFLDTIKVYRLGARRHCTCRMCSAMCHCICAAVN